MADAQPVWTARTGTSAAADLVAYGASTDTDQALIEADLAGSIAHVVGLHAADLVTTDEASELVEALQTLADEAAQGHLELDPALEDVHMNVEHHLENALGCELAGKLHTARSRNDQVALDLTLVTRQGLVEIAEAAHALASVLADTAAEHVETPWPVHTHGLPAQPATLGYLMHAHAVRLARGTQHVLDTFDGSDESPLGSGAGAGTTLPIDPAVSADLLGLAPPENALLATGTRDGSLAATQAAATLGQHAQALAIDLLDLAGTGAIELPAAYTTGSSIMPHKANPDALELVRADAGQLAAHAEAVQATTSGLGLGYHRDLQRAKPPLVDALDLAPQVLGVLANVVDGVTVHEAPLEALQASDGVATTDAVEALVEQGVPFRTAHQHLAQACQAADEGRPLEEALAEQDLPEAALYAAIDALETADPAERDTHGGPAPDAVEAALETLDATLEHLADEIAHASQAAGTPVDLLEAPPDALLALESEVTA